MRSAPSSRITVVRVAGDRELSDQEVLDCLKAQVPVLNRDATLEISVKATEEQVDKAMRLIMQRIVGRREVEQIKKISGIR